VGESNSSPNPVGDSDGKGHPLQTERVHLLGEYEGKESERVVHRAVEKTSEQVRRSLRAIRNHGSNEGQRRASEKLPRTIQTVRGIAPSTDLGDIEGLSDVHGASACWEVPPRNHRQTTIPCQVADTRGDRPSTEHSDGSQGSGLGDDGLAPGRETMRTSETDCEGCETLSRDWADTVRCEAKGTEREVAPRDTAGPDEVSGTVREARRCPVVGHKELPCLGDTPGGREAYRDQARRPHYETKLFEDASAQGSSAGIHLEASGAFGHGDDDGLSGSNGRGRGPGSRSHRSAARAYNHDRTSDLTKHFVYSHFPRDWIQLPSYSEPLERFGFFFQDSESSQLLQSILESAGVKFYER